MVSQKTDKTHRAKYADSDGDFDSLVDMAKSGHIDATDRLSRLAQQRLVPYFRSATSDPHEAADLLQETLLRMIRSLKTLNKNRAFWPWLMRIAANQVKNHYRRKARSRTIRFSAIREHTLEDMLQDNSRDAGRTALQHETDATVRMAVARLTEIPRKIVSMRCFDNMSYSQIGHVIGCGEVNARARFCRAKSKLRNHLGTAGITAV